jgi:hypothetical protein
MTDKPTHDYTPNLEKLHKICQEYVDFVYSKDYYEDNDYTEYF